MAQTVELSPDDARFLAAHLARYIASLDDELVHSDKREIQHALASEVERLRKLRAKIAAVD